MTPLLILLAILPSSVHAQAPMEGPGATAPSHGMARGDLDGDGIEELLIVHPSGLTLLMGQEGGGFAPCLPGVLPRVGGRDAAWRDVDADGDLDILVWGSDAAHLLLNEDGRLREASVESGFAVASEDVDSIQWTDLDGDGAEDVLLFTASGVVALRNLGQAHFEPLELGLPEASAPELPTTGTSPASAAPSSPAVELLDEATQPATSPAHDHGTFRRTRTPVASPPGGPSSSSPAGLQFGGFCAARIRDALGGGCLQASATPTLGMLMPLSTDFNLDAAGNVGIGTTSPTAKLDVAGDLHASGVLRSDALGTAPLVVQSSALVQNLNADLLDGKQASQFTQLGASIEGSEITDGTLTDADLSAGAAIAGTKVAPDFGAQNVTTTGLLSVGTASPLGRAHFQNNDLGLTASHLSGEAVTLESSDAYLGLVGGSGGQFGSGLTLREVTAGALADVWAMIRETNASGSDLRFTYGSNVTPYLNSTVLGLTADGKVGIGTSSPAVSLDIPTGADAALSGGGYVKLGSSSGLNMLLDDNELIARNGTSASTLHLNHDGGNVTVSASGTGNLGIGVSNPTAKLHVGGATGDGSVILPSSAISAGEIMDEPGVVSVIDGALGPSIPAGTWRALKTGTITAPSTGYVLAIAQLRILSDYAAGTYSIYVGLSTKGSTASDAHFRMSSSEWEFTTLHKVFPVTRAGQFSVDLSGDNSSTSPGSCSTSDIRLTLVFLPTAYGTVQ